MILNDKQHKKPAQLVIIDTATMRMTQYCGKIKGDTVVMNTNETPLKYIKESIQNFRLNKPQAGD